MGGRCFQKAALHRALWQVVQGEAQAALCSPPSPGACRRPLPVLGTSEGDIMMASVRGSVPFEGSKISRIHFVKVRATQVLLMDSGKQAQGRCRQVWAAPWPVSWPLSLRGQGAQSTWGLRDSHSGSWWKFHSLEPFPPGRSDLGTCCYFRCLESWSEQDRGACQDWVFLGSAECLGEGPAPLLCVCFQQVRRLENFLLHFWRI